MVNCMKKNIPLLLIFREIKYENIKYVWEINRLQFLSKVAFLYKKQGDEKYLELFVSLITSWIEANPYLIGVNWISNIEINLRLITWFLCWEILDINAIINKNEKIKKFVYDKWLPIIYLHCKYSFDNPSCYSSANNHLISELSGLFISSSYWKFNESPKWNCYSKKGLEKEILLQHSEEGINKEEASGYIQFVTDLLLLSYIVAEKTNNNFSQTFSERLEKILSHISNFIDVKGNHPRYGDDDNGKAFILDYSPNFNNFLSLSLSYSILFNKGASFDGYIDNKNKFLLGDRSNNETKMESKIYS